MCPSHSQGQCGFSLPSPFSLCSHDMDFLSTGMVMSHEAQRSEIYIRPLIETCDT